MFSVIKARPYSRTVLTTEIREIRRAKRLKADLIVMGTHGRSGLAKAFLGSTSDDVLRANRFNVLIVPTPATAKAHTH